MDLQGLMLPVAMTIGVFGLTAAASRADPRPDVGGEPVGQGPAVASAGPDVRFDEGLFAGAEAAYLEVGGSYRVVIGNSAWIAPRNAYPEILSVRIAGIFTLFGEAGDPSDDIAIEGPPMVFVPGEQIYLPLEPSELEGWDAVFIEVSFDHATGTVEYPTLGVLQAPGSSYHVGLLGTRPPGVENSSAGGSSPGAGPASPSAAGRRQKYDGGEPNGNFLEFECPPGSTRDADGNEPGCDLTIEIPGGPPQNSVIAPGTSGFVSGFTATTASSTYY